LRGRDLPVEEIAGGCFCCRFDELVSAAQRLTCKQPADVLVAEAVGSCTDLIATVSYPLQQLYGEQYTVAPLSVLIDPIQAARILGLEPEGAFSSDVRYIYQKQLEEADLIIINKSDLIEEPILERLRTMLAASFPAAELLVVSTRCQGNLGPWFQRLVFGQQKVRPVMDLDYTRYAAGEACLAWLNASVTFRALAKIDPDAWLLQLAREIYRGLESAAAEVAHLKLSLQAMDHAVRGTAVVSLVRRDLQPENGWRLGRAIDGGRVLINLRAETASDTLEATLKQSLARMERLNGLSIELERIECFRPSPPVPTHRIETLNSIAH